MTLQKLAELPVEEQVRLMREMGVLSYRFGYSSITLGMAVAKEIAEPLPAPEKESKLLCGHELWEANELGFCLHGCPTDKKEE